jgi:hypothetical protein
MLVTLYEKRGDCGVLNFSFSGGGVSFFFFLFFFLSEDEHILFFVLGWRRQSQQDKHKIGGKLKLKWQRSLKLSRNDLISKKKGNGKAEIFRLPKQRLGCATGL